MRARDYSFVVWSTEQEVRIASTDESHVSAAFPNYDLDDDTEIYDFNGNRIYSSDEGNSHDQVLPDDIVMPDPPVVPEFIQKDLVSAASFSDSYAANHVEMSTHASLMSKDSFEFGV